MMRHIDLFTQAIISLTWIGGLHAAFVPSTTNIIYNNNNKASYQRYMEKLEGVKDTILSSTPLQPTPPSPFVGFDPTNSEALVSITKGFIATGKSALWNSVQSSKGLLNSTKVIIIYVSITYSTRGEDRGKIIKLVTDMVLDRQIGNTNGLSGINAAAYIGGLEPSPFLDTPPLVALQRMFSQNLKPISTGDSLLAPFPDSVMIQLAKGVIASDFGLNDPNLLAENFLYLEKLIGPLDKEQYLKMFGEEYDLRDGMPDLDLRLANFRVDPYDPYRVWVDSSPRGVRTGNIGKRSLPPNVDALPYQGPPESISFTFDDDGFCTRYTSAVLDQLLGNTGGLGGIYGILEATGTPMNPLLTRSLNEFLSRASKSVLSSADAYKLSDGRLVNGGLPPLSSQPTKTVEVALPLPPKMPPVPPTLPTKPFFAAETVDQQERSPTIALPKTDKTKPADVKVGNKAQELRNAAVAARSEAAEAKKRALERKKALLDQERRLEAERKNNKEQSVSKFKPKEAASVVKGSEVKRSDFPKKQSPPAVAKRSPTINLFDSFSGSTKSTSKSKPKEAIVTKGSEVKRSPTLSLFGSSSEKKKTTQSKSMPKKISKKAKVAKSSTVKSPVINQSRPTISLFGLGGSTDSSSSSSEQSSSSNKAAELKQKKQKADAERKRKLDEEKKRKMDEVKAKREAQIKAKKEAAAIAKAKREKSALEKARKMEEAKAKRESIKKQSQSQVVNKKSTPPGKRPTFNLFGTGQPNKVETQTQVIKRQQTNQAVKGSGTFSLFGSSTAATKKSTSSSTATRAVKKTSQKKPSNINLFGGGSDLAPTTPKQKEVEKKQSSFGFFGASKGSSSSSTISLKSSSSQGGRLNKKTSKSVPAKKSKEDNIPILSRFTQNSDGSLTGIVSNSKDFKSGTKITTSPIKGKAVAGIVVKTSSGSQYRLQ